MGVWRFLTCSVCLAGGHVAPRLAMVHAASCIAPSRHIYTAEGLVTLAHIAQQSPAHVARGTRHRMQAFLYQSCLRHPDLPNSCAAPQAVKAQMIFWTAGFVLLTLMVQAPMLPTVLRWVGLAKLPPGEVKRRRELVAALAEHTDEVLQELRQDEEMLSGGGPACPLLPGSAC